MTFLQFPYSLYKIVCLFIFFQNQRTKYAWFLFSFYQLLSIWDALIYNFEEVILKYEFNLKIASSNAHLVIHTCIYFKIPTYFWLSTSKPLVQAFIDSSNISTYVLCACHYSVDILMSKTWHEFLISESW